MLEACIDRYEDATNCPEMLLTDFVAQQTSVVDIFLGWDGWRTVRGPVVAAVPFHLCFSEPNLLNPLETGCF